MRQEWDETLKVWKNIPDSPTDWASMPPVARPSVAELPPMPAVTPSAVGAPTPGPMPVPVGQSTQPAETGFFGTLKSVASGIGNWLADTPPTGAPAFQMPQDTKDTLVGSVFSNTDMPIVNPSPLPQPTPTEQVAAPAQPSTPIGANGGFTAEGRGQVDPNVPPPSPGLIPIKSEETRTKYADGTEEALFGEQGPYAQMQKVLAKKKQLDADLDAMTGKDPEIKKYYNKMLVGSTDLEALMDPNSPKFKEFADKITAVKGKLDTASKDLSEFQEKARVDPDRYWKTVPATTVAMNSLAMFMEGRTAGAAIRAGLTPPTGLVQAKIDKAIADDINRQKDEMRMGEAAKGNEINRYRDNLKMLGDERIAEVKTKLDYMTMVKGSLDQYMQKYKGQYDQLALDEISANLDMKKQLAMADFAKYAVRTESVRPTTGSSVSMDDQFKASNNLRSGYDTDTKANRDSIAQTAAIDSQLKLVKEANASGDTKSAQSAANAVRGMYAKLLQGAGVLSDSDLVAFGGSRSLIDKLKAKYAADIKGTLSEQELSDITSSIGALRDVNEYAIAQAQRSALERGSFLTSAPRTMLFSENELEPLRKWSGKTISSLTPLERLRKRQEEEEKNRAAKKQ